MDVLVAASSFYKSAQNSSTPKNMGRLLDFSNILASPYVREDLRSGLAATLESKIRALPEDSNWPITSQASKTAATNFYNAIKYYYNLLSGSFDKALAQRAFISVINQWDNYKLQYFTNDFLWSLQAYDFERYRFWYDLRKKITDAISSIDNILKGSGI